MRERWKWTIIILAQGIPWTAAFLFTSWFNEKQSNGVHTLSAGHALLLVLAQLTFGYIAMILVDW